MEKVDKGDPKYTPWHSTFGCALELALNRDKTYRIEPEYVLGKEPPVLDFLILTVETDIPPKEKEITRIFRKHNIVEYKSPEDSLDLNAFYKGMGYACFYKALGKEKDGETSIAEDEITLSFFRDTFPLHLFEDLRRSGRTIEEVSPGVYHVSGNKVVFPTQIIVTDRLGAEESHLPLRLISFRAKENEIHSFIRGTDKMKGFEKDWANQIIKLCLSKNPLLYLSTKEEFSMEEEWKALIHDDLVEFTITYLKSMVAHGLSPETAIEYLDIPVEERAQYLATLLK